MQVSSWFTNDESLLKLPLVWSSVEYYTVQLIQMLVISKKIWTCRFGDIIKQRTMVFHRAPLTDYWKVNTLDWWNETIESTWSKAMGYLPNHTKTQNADCRNITQNFWNVKTIVFAGGHIRRASVTLARSHKLHTKALALRKRLHTSPWSSRAVTSHQDNTSSNFSKPLPPSLHGSHTRPDPPSSLALCRLTLPTRSCITGRQLFLATLLAFPCVLNHSQH